MYKNGVGCDNNVVQAFKWYKKGAKQGKSGCHYFLADMYENGVGCEADLEKARAWYEKVCTGNCSVWKQDAQCAIERLDMLEKEDTERANNLMDLILGDIYAPSLNELTQVFQDTYGMNVDEDGGDRIPKAKRPKK